MASQWFLILAFLSISEAAKILVVFPFPSKSHNILGEGVVRNLLEAKHEVTYVTAFPKKNHPPNLHQIDVSANEDVMGTNMINISAIMEKNNKDPLDVSAFFSILLNLGNVTFNNENMKRLLDDHSQTFDVIINEWMFSEVTSGLSVVYDCPYIWLSSTEPHWSIMSLIDEGLNPAYSANVMTNNIPPFNFIQRVQELLGVIAPEILKSIYFTPYENKLFNEIFGPIVAKRGRTLPSYYDVRINASLMLGNSHVSLGQATRLPQNYKPIGGFHIKPTLEPLSEDIKKIMDNANHGVIYFSMGSNLKSKDMPDSVKESLLKMFGKLKYTVIWKFEEVLKNLPKNVHILQWAPQPSILAHKNCLLFITHGGLLSTTETVHYGVPTIGIPVFADQFNNVDKSVRKGFAKRVDLSFTMADELEVAIEEILNNPRYTETVKELSQIYHDRVVPPGAELVHWVEHVVRTRGAPHLRSPALHVPWYQKTYLDLLALIIAVLVITYKVLRRLFCSSKKVKSQKKNN